MALGRSEDIGGSSDGVPEVVDGAGCGLLQEGLQLGEGHLDRVEVGAVGRQEAQLGTHGRDGLTDAADPDLLDIADSREERPTGFLGTIVLEMTLQPFGAAPAAGGAAFGVQTRQISTWSVVATW